MHGPPRQFFLPFLSLCDLPPGACVPAAGSVLGGALLSSALAPPPAPFTVEFVTPEVYPAVNDVPSLTLPPAAAAAAAAAARVASRAEPPPPSSAGGAAAAAPSRLGRTSSASLRGPGATVAAAAAASASTASFAASGAPGDAAAALHGHGSLAHPQQQQQQQQHTVKGPSPSALHFSVTAAPAFAGRIASALDACKSQTLALYAAEGKPLESEDALPDSLKTFVATSSDRAAAIREFAMRRLREQVDAAQVRDA